MTPRTAAHQVPLSMGFSRQQHWNGLPFPSPVGSFPTQGSNPGILHCRQILYHLSHRNELFVCRFSHSVVSDSAIPGTAVHQPPLSMEFFRQEYWSGLPFPTPGDFLNPRTWNPCLLHWKAASSSLNHLRSPHNRLLHAYSVTQLCPTLRAHGM